MLVFWAPNICGEWPKYWHKPNLHYCKLRGDECLDREERRVRVFNETGREKREKGREKRFSAIFAQLWKNRRSDFVHRWIDLKFGEEVLHIWFLILYGWIVDTISEEGESSPARSC